MNSININDYTRTYTLPPYQTSKNIGEQGYLGYRQQEYERPDNFERSTKATLLAGLLQITTLAIQACSKKCSEKLMAGKEFEDKASVEKAANYMLKENKLDTKIGYLDHSNKTDYTKAVPQLKQAFEEVASGRNAFFVDELQLAVAPKSKPSLILHELGHAINAKAGCFMSYLQKTRNFSRYAPTALLFACGALAPKDDGKANFIERNAGLLGFCAYLPTIFEEGMASFNGIQAAKKALNNPKNLGILKRNYFFAWCTYLLAGIGLGISTKAAFLENKN